MMRNTKQKNVGHIAPPFVPARTAIVVGTRLAGQCEGDGGGHFSFPA